jgi:hypothetical protein
VDSWRRFWRLSRQEKSWFLQAAGWLPLTVLGIRWMGLRRWMDFLERISARASSSSTVPPAEATARMVAAAARRSLLPANCLSRSVVLWWFFHRRGLDAELRFGGRREGELLEAHAWVELDGKTFDVSETHSAGFVPFDRPVVSGEGKPH